MVPSRFSRIIFAAMLDEFDAAVRRGCRGRPLKQRIKDARDMVFTRHAQ